MRPKSVLAYRRKSPLERLRDNQPQNQRVETSGHKTGGPGGKAPGALSSGFLRRKPGSPAGVGGGTHLAGANLRWSRQDHLPRPPAGVASLPGLDRHRSRKPPPGRPLWFLFPIHFPIVPHHFAKFLVVF